MLQNITRIWLRLFNLKSPTLSEVSITVAEVTTKAWFVSVESAERYLDAKGTTVKIEKRLQS